MSCARREAYKSFPWAERAACNLASAPVDFCEPEAVSLSVIQVPPLDLGVGPTRLAASLVPLKAHSVQVVSRQQRFHRRLEVGQPRYFPQHGLH